MRMQLKGDAQGSVRIIHKFDSFTDFLAASVAAADPKDGDSHCDHGSWAGTDTFDEAVQLGRKGWAEIRPKVDAMLEPLREKLAEKLDMTTERQHDMIGYEPDIDRYLDGEIDCMWEDMLVEAPKAGKVHTLHISGVVASNISAETLAKRGAALVALVEAFTVCGAELEIWQEMSTSRPNHQWSVLTRVHRAGERLDVNAIMYPLAHPSMLRRLVFGLMEGESDDIRGRMGFRIGGGYGSPLDFAVSDQVDASFQMSVGGSRHSEAREIDADPVAWVLKTLEAQGVYNQGDGF